MYDTLNAIFSKWRKIQKKITVLYFEVDDYNKTASL